jgi:DNA (cytosine-5)-methyltransferase 1
MMMKRLRAVDLFCGAGGSTLGAAMSGKVDVRLAVNHWRVAIYTHQENHPGTDHLCAKIDHVDPRHDPAVPDFDLLMASPECTHFSVARGGLPMQDQKRATPWHVAIWAEAKRPRWIVVENVKEFRNWGPLDRKGRPIKSKRGDTFRAWIGALESLGYTVDHQVLNAADYGEATMRNRLFVIGRLGGRGDIPWPDPTHAGAHRSAAEIIDWSRPCPSIFARKRPLADKTLKRIEVGLRRFVGPTAEPFIVKMRGTSTCAPLSDPTPTVTAGGTHLALARPFLISYRGGKDPAKWERRQHGLEDPIPTIDTNPRYAIAQPFVMDVNHGGNDPRSYSIEDPLKTITTKRGQSLIVPFLTKYYGTGTAVGVDQPLDTITTKDRFGLAMAELRNTMDELGVMDVGFRMLDVDELACAMGFPREYTLFGNKAEQIKQVGNAVCPRVMKAICEAIAT